MATIHVLDNSTIDKIAAGEVVERPASVVKELVENAIDAGATAVTVDIKQGGISFIRITDDGDGIAKDQIRKAFLRHATSKILSVADLTVCQSLGFRGEALSSIAAVSKVELVTKQRDELMGVRYTLEGAVEKDMEDIGVPDGTTIIVRDLFYNTPVRRKFLKTPQTEASYISELMERLAMSKPDISFKYVVNGQLKFHTSGNGELKEIIYRIYGKDITKELLPIDYKNELLSVHGYIGKPTINRSNRNFENFFVNHRFIKSDIVGKAIEEAYKPYLMQHKFPFAILHLAIDTNQVDINVHPTKMEIRFSNPNELHQQIVEIVTNTLSHKELIPEVTIDIKNENHTVSRTDAEKKQIKEAHIEQIYSENEIEKQDIYYQAQKEKKLKHDKNNTPEPFEIHRKQENFVREETSYKTESKSEKPEMQTLFHATILNAQNQTPKSSNIIKSKDHILVEKPTQLNMFEEHLLTKEAKDNCRVLGQIFKTYWLMEYEDKLYIMDQHAAHEKIKYEALLKKLKTNQIASQQLNPPIVVSLSGREEAVLKDYQEYLLKLGFEIEEFGGNEYAIRSVPSDLYGRNEKELFEDILSELEENVISTNPSIIEEKIASMACKAAVKGNQTLSLDEVSELLNQLLELDNPYHCPHGRPTIISMSKYEIEKKFKRIL